MSTMTVREELLLREKLETVPAEEKEKSSQQRVSRSTVDPVLHTHFTRRGLL